MSEENIQEKEELIAENLVKSYKDRTVVRGVNIRMHKGEIVGLLGKNGAGKTTTFYMIVGLVRPNSGTIHFKNTDIFCFLLREYNFSFFNLLNTTV